MRLICPNCAAQYEIEAALVPESGRDVQCSACGHAWFQLPMRQVEVTASAPTADPVEADGELPLATGTADAGPQPGPQPAPGSAEAGQQPDQRRIDPSILDILRSEAEFEARARRSEAGALESQDELGLTAVRPTRPPASGARPAPTGGEPATRAPLAGPPSGAADIAADALDGAEAEAADAAQAARRRARRERLPDPDSFEPTPGAAESTDGASDEGDDATATRDSGGRSGFRWGFLLSVALLALASLFYVGADSLRGLVPAADPLIDGFVTMVDGWRTWLNARLRVAIDALSTG